METYYLILVIILCALAISDLVVGVSNDAVNFLNSAVGSKAANIKIVLAVATLGIFIGATFSNGMMEVARSGIITPSNFTFEDVMIIFISAMLADVILLDIFNTYGLPTSTTVSIVFDLLGAGIGLAITKIMHDPNALPLHEYINSAKTLGIVSGILLSVIIAFTFGAIIQYLVRIFFSFNYKERFKYFGSIFGGLAITIILNFLVVKGAKDLTFLTNDIKDYIHNNTGFLLLVNFLFWSGFLQILRWLFKINILVVIVLVGTFSLAMAFAGNDLVNFIGVPLAGYHSYTIYLDNPGIAPDSLKMVGLMKEIQTPTIILLVSGLIMVITLITSKKAKTVMRTEVNLGRQGEGAERFGSSAFARSIVRASVSIGTKIDNLTPNRIRTYIDSRFIVPSKSKQKNAPSFDMLRASVILVVSSVVIAFGTSYKLPLSTTYVTFMVAMGTSLADRSWGKDSAVYRITGVMSVIGGWFLTGLSAFIISLTISSLIHYGGAVALVLILALAVYLFYKSHVIHKKNEKKTKEKECIYNDTSQLTIQGVINHCSTNVLSIVEDVTINYENTLKGLVKQDRKLIRKSLNNIKEVNQQTKLLKDNVFITIKRLEEESLSHGHYYVQVLDYLRETAHCLTYIANPSYEYVNNNHKEFIDTQKEDLTYIKTNIVKFLNKLNEIIKHNDFDAVKDLLDDQLSIIYELDLMSKRQVKRIKNDETGTKNSLLFLSIIHETKNLVLHSINLLKAQRDFVLSDKIE